MVIKSLKLQLSFEFVLALGLVMIAVLPLIYIGYTKTNESLEDLRNTKTRYLVTTLKDKYEEVYLTKGEIKAKILVPSASAFSIASSGSIKVLNASLKVENKDSYFVATLPQNVRDFSYTNSNQKVDDEIILRIYYNASDNLIYTTVFA